MDVRLTPPDVTAAHRHRIPQRQLGDLAARKLIEVTSCLPSPLLISRLVAHHQGDQLLGHRYCFATRCTSAAVTAWIRSRWVDQ